MSEESKPNLRGEIALNFNGQPVTLRPTFKAVTRLEEIAGKGLMAIAKTMAEGVPAVTDVARVIWCGFMAERVLNPDTGRAYTIDQIGEIIVRDGAAKFFGVVGEFLGGVLSGGPAGEEASSK